MIFKCFSDLNVGWNTQTVHLKKEGITETRLHPPIFNMMHECCGIHLFRTHGGGPSACSLLLQSPLHLSSTQLQCHCLQKFFPLPDRARIRFFFKVRPAFSHKCNGLYFVVVTCVSFRDTQTFTGIWTLSLSS